MQMADKLSMFRRRHNGIIQNIVTTIITIVLKERESLVDHSRNWEKSFWKSATLAVPQGIRMIQIE